MIKQVKFNNFRNKKGEQELTGFDVFTGPNGSGKSSVINAIQLTVTGSVNSYNQPKDIINNANGDSFSVGVETSNGFSAEREFDKKTRKSKDKDTGVVTKSTVFSQKINVSKPARTNKDKEKVIVEELGIIPMAFDFASFSGLTDTGKKEYLLSYLNEKLKYDKKDMFAYLDAAIKTEKLDRDSFYKNFEVLFKKAESKDILGKAKEITAISKENLSFLKKEESRLKMSIEKMTEQITEFSVNNKELNLEKEKLNKLTETLVSLEKQKSLIEADNKKAAENIKKIEAINKEIEEIKKTTIRKPEDIQKELVALEEKLKEVIHFQKIVADNVSKLSEQYKLVNNETQALRLKHNKIKEDGTSLKVEYQTEVALLEEVENTKGHCKINLSIPCNADFSKWVVEKKKELLIKKEALTKKVKEFKEIDDLLTKNEKSLEDISNKREHYITKQSAGALKNSELSNKKTAFSTELEKSKNFISLKDEKIKSKLKEIENLENDKKEIKDISKLDNNINNTNKEITEIKDLISKKEQVNVLQKQITALKTEYSEVNKNLDFHNFIVKYMGVKGIQAEILRRLVEPFINEINDNLALLDFKKKFFIKTLDSNDKEVFDFGIDNILFDTLSRGQQLILSIAMISAFIGNSNSPTKIICLDNINELDVLNIEKTLVGLKAIKDKYNIDNILVAGCIEAPKNDCYKTWKLS